jgi:hypothetical protein
MIGTRDKFPHKGFRWPTPPHNTDPHGGKSDKGIEEDE